MKISIITYHSVSTCTYMKSNIFVKSTGYSEHFYRQIREIFFSDHNKTAGKKGKAKKRGQIYCAAGQGRVVNG